MRFDLHMHTYYSDGSFSPSQVMEECRKADLRVVSLTDHDNVSGIPEALGAGEDLGIEVIPGIELGADWSGKELHILGYFIDWQNPELAKFLERWEKRRVDRAEKIVHKLTKLGFDLTLDEVKARARGSVGRSHVCWAVFDNGKNANPLRFWGTPEKDEFFKKFLKKDGLAFAPLKNPSAQQVIALIQGLGGMAFWAHPYLGLDGHKEVSDTAAALQKLGLDGLEVFYYSYGQERILALHELAQQLSLFESGGSDFHGPHTKRSGAVGQIQLFGLEPRLPLCKDR